jgi:serine/threonine protein kinase
MSASRQSGFVHEQTPARVQPQELGRYLLLERIGGGGMAEIFRGTTVGADNFRRNVVIKRMLPELSSDENFMKMFVDEANICAQLNHPNIVHVHELGVHEGQYFMVMEEINGVDLGRTMKYLTDHGLGVPPCIVADIGRQLTRGLSYAHSMSVDGTPMRIVHRDVTPTNVMIANTGVIKILDFGIARTAEAFRIGRTSVGEIKGKCAYLSPEQLALAPIDHRVDIFAAGVLLHELLLGRRLFKAETSWATIQAVSEMPIPRPSEVDHRIPAALEEIVLKMLARNPAERYQEAGQIADALDAFLVKQQYQSHELLTFAMDICQAIQPAKRSAPSVGTPARIAVKAVVSVVQAPRASVAADAASENDDVLSPSQVSMVLEQPILAAPTPATIPADAEPGEEPAGVDGDDIDVSAQDTDEPDSPFLPFTPGEEEAATYVDPNLEPSMVIPAWGQTARLDLLKSFGPLPSEEELAKAAKPSKPAKVKKSSPPDKRAKPAKSAKPAQPTATSESGEDGEESEDGEVEKTEDIGPITRIIRHHTITRRLVTAAVLAYTLWITFGPQQQLVASVAAASATPQAAPAPTIARQPDMPGHVATDEPSLPVPAPVPAPVPPPYPPANQLPPLDTAPRAGDYDDDDFPQTSDPAPRSKTNTFKKVRHALPVDPFTD